MLREFLTANRRELINRCRAKVLKRRAPRATPAELEHGIPLFLDQLTDMFPGRTASFGAGARGRAGSVSAESDIESGAIKHGSELLSHGFSIDQVVHDYGDLCQSITELAGEQGAPITVEEFGTLNIRLDNAIAGAVTEYSRQHAIARSDQGALATNERLGVLAHEMRNLLNTTILAISAIKRGSVGFSGATAGALDRSLIGMRALIDRTLAEVRLEFGTKPSREVIEMGPFIADVQVAAALEASNSRCELTVLPVEPDIFVEADRHMLAAAVANLLQNAFKFTRPESHVLLRVYTSKGRVLIEVEDECGGLPHGATEQIFRWVEQRSADRSGVGLGLSISREGVEASGGELYARNIPGKGCVFTIDLPERAKRAAAPGPPSRRDRLPDRRSYGVREERQ
jgi:signal transduction histidine kinase